MGQSSVIEQDSVIVNVPAGTLPGSTFVIEDAGHRVPAGAVGKLFVTFLAVPHEKYTMDNVGNLHIEERIPFTHLTLGCARQLVLIDGRTVNVKIAAGTQPGTVLRITGGGMNATTDLYATVGVTVPTELSDRARDLLNELQETLAC